jgi:hypothetical protein
MESGGITAVIFAILFILVSVSYGHKLWTEGAFTMPSLGFSPALIFGKTFLSLLILYLPNTLFAYGFIADLMNSHYHYSAAGVTALAGMILNKLIGGVVVDGIVSVLSFIGTQFAKLPLAAKALIGVAGVGAAAVAAPVVAAAAAPGAPVFAPGMFGAPGAAATASGVFGTAPAGAAATATGLFGTAPAAAAAAANPFGVGAAGLGAAANPFGVGAAGLGAAANPFAAAPAAAAAALPAIAPPAAAAAVAAPVIAAAAERNPFADAQAAERAENARLAAEEATERRRAEPGANPFRGGRRTQRGGNTNMCTLPGFEWLENTIAPQGIIMSMTVLWYLMIELWDTGAASQSIALGATTSVVFILQSLMLYNNNCLSAYKYGNYSVIISLFMAITFAASSYFIQKRFLSGSPASSGGGGSSPPVPTPSGPKCPDGTVLNSSGTMCLPTLPGTSGKKVSVGDPSGTSAPVNDDDQFVCEAYRDGEVVTSTIVE